MNVFMVSIREDSYYELTMGLFMEKDVAERYATRLRESGEIAFVEEWAVNEELPDWDGEE